MANLDNFISHFAKHNEFSKTSRFEVYILGAPVGGVSTEGLRFQCETSELPGYNIDTVDGLVYGAPYAIAAKPAYNELNLTFICAGDLWEKKFFDSWLQYILPQTNYVAKYRDEYTSTIRVSTYTDQGKASHQVEFIEAFPNTVAPIALNWADDGINRVSVGFKYRKWRSLPVQGFMNTAYTLPLLGSSIEPNIAPAPRLIGTVQDPYSTLSPRFLGDGGFINIP